MKNLKTQTVAILLILVFSQVRAEKTISIATVTNLGHPRILLLQEEKCLIEQSIAQSKTWAQMHQAILDECNQIIDLPPVERIQIGKRLLDKSREALRRIFQLSYAWRMTQDEKYFNRCEKEMLAIASFSDWNPSHFLDVAEMTMAMAIGYDWLYNDLSSKSKEIIRNAMLVKGINPSFDSKYNWFLTAEHNWNQVCNAGMTYGALAIAEDEPELAEKVINRAIETIPLAMAGYKPDGAYPEGYGYWGYGTSFNVMFLSAIETVFKSDFGLSETAGFLKTAGFLQNMTGVTGACYNWGDCGLGGNLNPAMFWFAAKNNDPSLLWVEKSYFDKDNFSGFTRERLLPAIMIWGKNNHLEKIEVPKEKAWMGQGANPVAMMRTSWTDPKAIFLGFKAGSSSVNHGHMDVGSFIMEANGVRWASDFGSQNYESLESKGIALFGRSQDAQRWTIFRLNNRAHNTLTINDQLQNVKGYAKIDKFSDKTKFMYAISDISSVYENQMQEVKRGAAIVDEKFVVISDQLKGGDQTTTVRWNMLTTANPQLGDKSIILEKDGKKLTMLFNVDAQITMKTWSTTPTTTYDAPNPGTSLVGFEMQLKPRESKSIQVLLIPETVNAEQVKFNKKLTSWE